MKQLLLIALGGGTGSVLRYLVSLWMARCCPSPFPVGTFAVNMLGCFLMGLLLGLADRHAVFNEELRSLLIIGFCGGFTTFSTFSAENVNLFGSGSYGLAALYIGASVAVV